MNVICVDDEQPALDTFRSKAKGFSEIESLRLFSDCGDSCDAAGIGDAVNQRLRKICDDMHKLYRLSVSVGGYSVTGAKEGIENIIAKADQELYKNKAKRQQDVFDAGYFMIVFFKKF